MLNEATLTKKEMEIRINNSKKKEKIKCCQLEEMKE
jgi:hypothetical protein